MPSTVINASAGAAHSRAVRSAKADARLHEVAKHIEALARSGELADTNDGIAVQLHTRGITAGRGGKLDGRKVHADLTRMGIDRPAIKRWRNLASKRALEWDESFADLLYQLWHEWQRHEAISVFRLGLSLNERHERPFVPAFVRSRDWVPPWVCDPDVVIGLLGPPPWAKLVQALMGTLDPDNEDDG